MLTTSVFIVGRILVRYGGGVNGRLTDTVAEDVQRQQWRKRRWQLHGGGVLTTTILREAEYDFMLHARMRVSTSRLVYQMITGGRRNRRNSYLTNYVTVPLIFVGVSPKVFAFAKTYTRVRTTAHPLPQRCYCYKFTPPKVPAGLTSRTPARLPPGRAPPRKTQAVLPSPRDVGAALQDDKFRFASAQTRSLWSGRKIPTPQTPAARNTGYPYRRQCITCRARGVRFEIVEDTRRRAARADIDVGHGGIFSPLDDDAGIVKDGLKPPRMVPARQSPPLRHDCISPPAVAHTVSAAPKYRYGHRGRAGQKPRSDDRRTLPARYGSSRESVVALMRGTTVLAAQHKLKKLVRGNAPKRFALNGCSPETVTGEGSRARIDLRAHESARKAPQQARCVSATAPTAPQVMQSLFMLLSQCRGISARRTNRSPYGLGQRLELASLVMPPADLSPTTPI